MVARGHVRRHGRAVNIPDLATVTGGAYEATCGTCLKRSVPVAAVEAERAWDELLKLGWTLYIPVTNPRGTLGARHAGPTWANPVTIEDAVRAARRKRKRR
jgi:hypothetical protein